MIISHRYKFIFVKTTKTAGTSIEAYLSALCSDEDVFTPIYPPSKDLEPRNFGGEPLPDLKGLSPAEFSELVGKHRFRNHMGAKEIRSRVEPEVWASYFKFCVERNPWDKVVSHYYMALARSDIPITFAEFLDRRRFPVDLRKWYDHENKEFLVDRVLRYEHLNAELADVFGELSIPFQNGLTTREKAGYRAERRPYQEYYCNPSDVAAVGNVFAKEIDLLGYSFT